VKYYVCNSNRWCRHIGAIGIYGDHVCVKSRIKLAGIFGYPCKIISKTDFISFLFLFKHINITKAERTKMLKQFAKNYISSIIYIPYVDNERR